MKRSVVVFDFTQTRTYRLSGWRLWVHERRRRWRMRKVRMTCEGLPGDCLPERWRDL